MDTVIANCSHGILRAMSISEHPLRYLLQGPPLKDRDSTELQRFEDFLDAELTALLDFLDTLGVEKVIYADAKAEMATVLAMTGTEEAVQSKRGMLLYAISTEPTIRKRYAATDPELLQDLTSRVFPLVIPIFLRNLGQRPDAYAALLLMLTELWPEIPFVLAKEWQKKDDANEVQFYSLD